MSKKNIRYIILGLIAVGVVSGAVIYDQVFNAEHRVISEEIADFTIPAEDLQFYFANDQENATSKYMNKVVETYGSVTEVGINHIVLDNRAQVDFMDLVEQGITAGSTVRIKGRCVGFDELLLLVKIDQSTIIKN